MKIKLNEEQIRFLKSITKNTEFEKNVSLFSANKEFELDEDLADELRDLCADYEVDNLQKHDDMSLDAEGRIAYDLVDLLYC